MCAAAKVASVGLGVQKMTSGTPATLAGIAVMSTVEGYSAVPPGT